MEEEEEWESELADNITTFYGNGSDATAIVIDGTTVRKPNGLVLISGNLGSYKSSTSTEIYDSINNYIRKGPEIKVNRYCHTLVTLKTGEVGVFGGYSSDMKCPWLSVSEVYNAASNSFSIVGNMVERRQSPAAVSLPNGLVLIIGGYDGPEWLNTCEFYNPLSKTFSPSKAKLMVGRWCHTASLLPDGRVLVCGGNGISPMQTTEIYDPSTDSFSDGPLMTVNRSLHTATTLANGRILLTGGENDMSSSSTEIYDPTTNSFSEGPEMVVARAYHFSALLQDGRVLIGGGETIESKQTTEIYDPATNSFTKGLDLLEKRHRAAASNF